MPINESYGLRFFVPFRTGVSKPEWREASTIALQENYYFLLFFNCFRWRASRKTVTFTPLTILLFCSTKQQSFKQQHHYYCKSFIMYVQDNYSFIYGTEFITMATITIRDISFSVTSFDTKNIQQYLFRVCFSILHFLQFYALWLMCSENLHGIVRFLFVHNTYDMCVKFWDGFKLQHLFTSMHLLLWWKCNTVEPLFCSQFLYNNSCEYARPAHMTAQNNGECFPNIYDTCFLTSKWLWLQYWDDRKVEVLQCPSSTVISIKVHLHWAKANVKANFSFIFVAAQYEH